MSEPWYRVAFGAFYPVLYAHRDDAEAARCVAMLGRLAPLGDERRLPILDLGCGDGRHLAHLRPLGLPVVGLDLSRPLLRAARARAPESAVVCGDMLRLPVRDGSCGAVLSLFTAFGYFGAGGALTRDSGDGAVASGIGRVLAAGGHWFLDYLDADRVRRELADGPRVRDRVAGPLSVRETRRLARDGASVAKDVRLSALPGREEESAALGVDGEGLAYREELGLYSLAELDRLAAGGGLERVAGVGGYDGVPLGAGPRWLLAYRKDDGA